MESRGTKLSMLITAAIAVAVSGLVAGAADARVVTQSKLNISRSVPLYHGSVKSDFAQCEKGRRVVLWRAQAGADQKMGADRTNNKGKWKVNVQDELLPVDKFYALMKAKEVSSAGTGISCSGDKSKFVNYTADVRATPRVVTETKLGISNTLPLYHGKVKSVYKECRKDRKVILFKVKPGDDKKVGKDEASGKGYWKVDPGNLSPGDQFYAKVRNVGIDSVGGTGLSCIGDKSKTVTFVGD